MQQETRQTEPPMVAKGLDEPLVEGMVIALEPKRGVAGVGMVGSENTYLVTPSGGKSLTGKHPGLMGGGIEADPGPRRSPASFDL